MEVVLLLLTAVVMYPPLLLRANIRNEVSPSITKRAGLLQKAQSSQPYLLCIHVSEWKQLLQQLC